MYGITSYGTYIPFRRLKKSTAAAAFGKTAAKGEKAVAYCDEDSITMAAAAAQNAMLGRKTDNLETICFASTTFPYREKQCATQIAAVLDLDIKVYTMDFANTLRAGSSAMLQCCKGLEDGKEALTVISDCRLGAADGKFEAELGDGAVAFLMGTKDILAIIDGSCSVSKDAMDVWRAENDTFVRNWDVRYAASQLYQPLVKTAVECLYKKLGVENKDFTKLILYGHDDKIRKALAAKLGFEAERLADSLYSEIGNTGCAAAGIMLAAELDNAKPGDRFLFVSYGEGCDAVSVTVTEGIAKRHMLCSVREQINAKDNELPYGKYLKWKGMIDCEPQKRPEQERSSLPDYYRNYRKNNALYGCRCTICGTIVFPPQRVCVHCHSIDKMEPYRLADKKAVIRTFTMDGLSLSPDAPNYLVVIEFDGGGKMMTYLVDCHKNDIQVGMKVKPAFRKIFDVNGVHTYFWKVVPVRGEE